MLQGTAILLLSLAYLGLLFAIAHAGDRLSPRWYTGRIGAIIYSLSLAIYCTSWTFYGSVGRAATVGADFILIYVGPILAITAGYPLMRKMIAVSRRQNVTSIADFLGSRYGKSRAVAVLATLTAVIGVLPYIALQMQAVTITFEVLVGTDVAHLLNATLPPPWRDTSMFVAAIMALFTILFGVRSVQATEQHRGMMLAIAFESLVKLAALLLVGCFVVFGLFDNPVQLLSSIVDAPDLTQRLTAGFGTNWIVMTILSGFAFLCLPRQFHVAVVEHGDPSSLQTARWLFPVYLVVINIFVVPIAAAGLLLIGKGANPDLFVITLPLLAEQQAVAAFAFIGGLSAATSMVIVACMALSIMVSNELVTPFLLRSRAGGSGEVGRLVLNVRRGAVVVILLLAYIYHSWIAGHLPLASIGMISFCAVANFAPAVLLGLYWRGAHRYGVIAGLTAGFAVWLYTLLLPSIEGAKRGTPMQPPLADYLPAPLDGFDPTLQGFIACQIVNLILLVLVSLLAAPRARDVEQAEIFVSGGDGDLPQPPVNEDVTHDPRIEELRAVAVRFLGVDRVQRAFGNRRMSLPEAVAFTEHLLSGAIGAASARIVMASAQAKGNLSPRAARAMLGEASEAIRHNLDLLRTTLDHIGQGIGVFDNQRRLAAWNQRFFDLLGLPANLAEIGVRVDDMASHGTPELTQILATHAPRSGTGSRIHERRRSDGAVLEIRIDPMPDGGFVATCTDVTERVRAAEALRASERAIRVYTDNVPVLIAYVDRDERYRFTNMPFRRALNLPQEQIDGKPIREMLSAERYERLRPYIDAALAGRRQSFEIEFPTNDEKIEVAQGTYIPHRDASGSIAGFFLLYQDITERRRADAALRAAYASLERRVAERTAELEKSRAEAEAANLGKTRFLAAASHDLLQPLHAARLFTAALAEREPENDLVARIDHGLGAVEALLDALLDISKLDAGAVRPEPRPVALDPLLGSLVAAFAPLAARRGVSLKMVPTQLTVQSDPALLRRVLQNFVANAIRYCRLDAGNRRVLIGCRRSGESVRIEVWDNGPGIPADKREVIFQEFARLENPQVDAGERGLGLGLAIVERIARMLDSPITLRSEVGRGSVFAITVPLAAAEASPQPAAQPAPSMTAASLEGCFVLCIDNEAGVREAMHTLIGGWHCDVAAVENLENARQAAAQRGRGPDIILADLHLGDGMEDRADGLDGLEVIARLRQDWGRQIPAVLITADRAQDLRRRCQGLGIDLLHKPVRPAALRALISQRWRPTAKLDATGD
ncbi:NahK/ErcS family hybrid sensor histidine kinase/response regulator [Ferrovibrio sp.]|uniref:hybrid sensor histidine kinase/response regulator n=1 Tax=Ferrovibrio sp. TaxID=1917215 RepID=UPI003D2DD56B